MKLVTVKELHARKVKELRLDPSAFDLSTTEAISAAIRRAGGFLCPCSTNTLVRAVVNPLEGIVSDLQEFKKAAEAALEALVAHGDFIEQADISGSGRGALLYAAPPGFVPRQSGAVLLVGVTTDFVSPLPDELDAFVEYHNHIRKIPGKPGRNLNAELRELGLIEILPKDWLRAPQPETHVNYIAKMDKMLNVAAASGDVPGLTLLDPTTSVFYYPKRWVKLRSQSGRFVARRSQAYGADLWCYVEMYDGCPQRFIDLPIHKGRNRGCDEAWQLQLAIDARQGKPQRFELVQGASGASVVKFFSPIPMWACRRWEAIGQPALGTGCLFAYRFAKRELSEEVRYCREELWLAEVDARGTK